MVLGMLKILLNKKISLFITIKSRCRVQMLLQQML